MIGRLAKDALTGRYFTFFINFSPGLWIAANELPLHEALIPFLIARSGKALDAFARWVAGRMPPCG